MSACAAAAAARSRCCHGGDGDDDDDATIDGLRVVLCGGGDRGGTQLTAAAAAAVSSPLKTNRTRSLTLVRSHTLYCLVRTPPLTPRALSPIKPRRRRRSFGPSLTPSPPITALASYSAVLNIFCPCLSAPTARLYGIFFVSRFRPVRVSISLAPPSTTVHERDRRTRTAPDDRFVYVRDPSPPHLRARATPVPDAINIRTQGATTLLSRRFRTCGPNVPGCSPACARAPPTVLVLRHFQRVVVLLVTATSRIATFFVQYTTTCTTTVHNIMYNTQLFYRMCGCRIGGIHPSREF